MAERYANIAVVDIEQFGTRSDLMQTLLRRRLHEILDCSLATAGVDPTGPAVDRIDRGDGIALILDANVSKQIVTGRFVDALVEELRRHGITSLPAARIRLRLSLHSGEVSANHGSYSGTALNTACRLVDLDALRTVLAAAPETHLVVGVSSEWHQAVVGQDWADGADYSVVPFVSKEVRSQAYVRVPGHRAPAGAAPETADAGVAHPATGTNTGTDAPGDDRPRPATGPRPAAPAVPAAQQITLGDGVTASVVAGRDYVGRDSIRKKRIHKGHGEERR